MRGRQSWVFLFAYKPCALWDSKIAEMLPDPDIEGHVISAVYKMRASGFSDEILPYRGSGVTWVRKAANRYLEFDQSKNS